MNFKFVNLLVNHQIYETILMSLNNFKNYKDNLDYKMVKQIFFFKMIIIFILLFLINLIFSNNFKSY